MLRLAFATVALSLVGLPAQTAPPDAARLPALLQELGQLDARVWAARCEALEQAARAQETLAAQRRSEAAKLLEQAGAAEAAAKRCRDEIAQLRDLEKLLRGRGPSALPTPGEAPTQPAAKTPAPAAAMVAAPPSPPTPSPRPAAAAPAVATAADASPQLVDWAAVEPLLQDRCSACHEPNDKKGGLDVTSFAALRQGGSSGRTLAPGEPEQSRLWRLVAQLETPFMPKGEEPLGKEQLALLHTWIEQGAAETKAQARAFLAARHAAAKEAGPDDAKAGPGPVPHDLPAVPLQRPARPGAVKALARSPNAALLAMPGLQQVLLFDAALQPLGVLPVEGPAVGPLAFAHDGRQLVVATGQPGRSGQAQVFDVATGRPLGRVGNERDVPLAAAVHGTLGLVALGGAGKHANVHRLADGQAVLHGAHDDFVLALQFSPDGTLLAAGDRGGDVRLWDTAGGGLLETLRGHRGAVHALAFARNGARLFTAGADGTVRAFDPAQGKELWKQVAHAGEALGLALGPDGRIASCGSDGLIVVHDAAGKLLGKSPAAGEWLYAVAFGTDGNDLFAGDWQGRVHHFVLGGKQKVMDATTPLRGGA